MNSLKNKAQSSKLNITKKKQDKVININRKPAWKIQSFCLDETSVSQLKEIVERINVLTRTKARASNVVKALIYLGMNEISDDKLLKALKEISF